MIKKKLHPKLYKTQIKFENQFITDLLTTEIEINILIWSGNHPFYNNSEKNLELESYTSKFQKKYKNFKL